MRKKVKDLWARWEDVISTSAFDFTQKALGVVSGVLTARLLLPKGKGELTAVLVWFGLFNLFGGLGMGQAIVYYCGEQSDSRGVVAGTAALIGLAQGVLIGTLGVFLIPLLLTGYDGQVVFAAQVLFCWAPLIRIGSYSQRILHGRGDFRPWNMTRIAPNIIYTSSIVVLWLLGILTVTTTIWGYLAGQITLVVLAVTFVLIRIDQFGADVDLGRKMVTYGGKNYLASLMDNANHRVDQAIMSVYFGPTMLGLYRVAVSASKLLSPIGTGFQRVLISDVSRSEDEGDRNRLISESLRASAPAMTLAALALGVAMPWILPFAFGSEYQPAVIPAIILLGAALVFGLKNILYNGLRGKGLPIIPLYGEAVGLVVTALGLYLLLKPFELVGASIVSIVAYTSSISLAWYLHRR